MRVLGFRHFILLLAVLGVTRLAHGAVTNSCTQLMGLPIASSNTPQSPAVRAYLNLLDLGLQNIVSDRTALIQKLHSSSVSRYPVNPFLNLDQPVARALSAKVEAWLPQLSADWSELRVHLEERANAFADGQAKRNADRNTTRTVREMVSLPFDERRFGRFSINQDLAFDGQTASHYFVSTPTEADGRQKRFQISKRFPSFEEIIQDQEAPWGNSRRDRYLSLGQVYGFDSGFKVSRARIGPSFVFSIANVASESSALPPVTFSDPTERFEVGGSMTTFVAVGQGNPSERSLLFLHEGHNRELIRLALIERGTWQERSVQIQGGPTVDCPGNWTMFKNEQGEILLSYKKRGIDPKELERAPIFVTFNDLPTIGQSRDEVALWMFDPDTLRFKLQFHETLDESSISVLIDYEQKSFVGWVLPFKLLIYREIDLSTSGDEL